MIQDQHILLVQQMQSISHELYTDLKPKLRNLPGQSQSQRALRQQLNALESHLDSVMDSMWQVQQETPQVDA